MHRCRGGDGIQVLSWKGYAPKSGDNRHGVQKHRTWLVICGAQPLSRRPDGHSSSSGSHNRRPSHDAQPPWSSEQAIAHQQSLVSDPSVDGHLSLVHQHTLLHQHDRRCARCAPARAVAQPLQRRTDLASSVREQLSQPHQPHRRHSPLPSTVAPPSHRRPCQLLGADRRLQ